MVDFAHKVGEERVFMIEEVGAALFTAPQFGHKKARYVVSACGAKLWVQGTPKFKPKAGELVVLRCVMLNKYFPQDDVALWKVVR